MKLNLEISKDELECEHCDEEFEHQKLYYEHINLCPVYIKRLSKNTQQNHIQYDHQELYSDNFEKYFTQLSNMKEHGGKMYQLRKMLQEFQFYS